MKKILIISLIIVLSIACIIFVCVKNSKSQKAAGLVDGKLTKCSEKPNCVCSEFSNDGEHYVEPLKFEGSVHDAIEVLKKIIKESGGLVQRISDNYFAVTFTTKIIGFIDDFEIRIDPEAKLIHMRSASRVGYGDLGVNKKRVENIKNLFAKAHK